MNIIHSGSKIPRFIKHYSGIYQYFRTRLATKISILLQKDEKDQKEISDKERFPFVEETWQKIERLLLKMKKISEDHNSKFIILIIPIIQGLILNYGCSINNNIARFCQSRIVAFFCCEFLSSPLSIKVNYLLS